MAFEDHIIQGIAVDRQAECLPDPGIATQRAIGALPSTDIDVDTRVTERHGGRDLETLIPCDARHVGGRNLFNKVESAGKQICHSHGRVGHDSIDDASDMDPILIPIIRKPFERDVVLCNALHQTVRASADRLRAELVAGCLCRLGRNHHAAGDHEAGEQLTGE